MLRQYRFPLMCKKVNHIVVGELVIHLFHICQLSTASEPHTHITYTFNDCQNDMKCLINLFKKDWRNLLSIT